MKRFYVMTYRTAAVTVSLLVVIAFSTGRGHAAEPVKPVSLRLAYSAITVNQAIPWISYEAGHL